MYTFTMVGCTLFKLCHCKCAKAYSLEILGMSRLWHDLMAHGHSDNQGHFVERDNLKSTRGCGLSTEWNNTSTFTDSILYKAEGFILRDSTGMKCDSVLFTCHDGQDQWAEKSLFFIQWSAIVSDWWAPYMMTKHDAQTVMTWVVPVSFYYDDFEWNDWSKSETARLRSNIDNEKSDAYNTVDNTACGSEFSNHGTCNSNTYTLMDVEYSSPRWSERRERLGNSFPSTSRGIFWTTRKCQMR